MHKTKNIVRLLNCLFRVFLGLVKVLLVLLVIFLVLFSVLFALFAGKECVKLPNGIIVAYDSYFNFTESYLTPNVVVKGPDGTILSRGNDGVFYFSETTAWWTDYHPGDHPDNRNEGLAYRPDTGLVSAWDDPALWKQLKNEAGPLLEEGKKLRNTNVLGVLAFLGDDPKYHSLDCSVPLFSFEKSYP